jgi:hypothetical protein
MQTKQNKCETISMKQIFSMTNLSRAARKVANYYRLQNYGGSPDAGLVLLEQDSVLTALREAVMDGNYQFQPLRPYITPKKDGSPRIENISSALDRIVVQALLNGPGWKIQQQLTATATIGHTVVAPAYRFQGPSRWFMYTQWQKDYRSFKRMNLQFARRHKNGHMLHLDLQQFFPSVSRDRLRGMLEPYFAPAAWQLMDRYLDFTTVRNGEVMHFGNGLPIEEPSSRLLANFYLLRLDQFVIHKLGIHYTRYMDDMFFFLPSKEAADAVRHRVVEFLALQLGLFTNGKNYDMPAKDFLASADTKLSQELSAVDHQMSVLPFSPELRPGLEATLKIMLKGMPGPNANPEAEGHAEKIKKASFAAYRVAKLNLVNQEDQLALLLPNEKSRRMALIALCILDTPAANQHLGRFMRSQVGSMPSFDMIRLAGTLLGYGIIHLLWHLEKDALKNPELLAIVRQGSGGPIQVRASLRHADALVRKAAAIRLAAHPSHHRPLIEDLIMAAGREQDRDTLGLFLIAAKQFSGNPDARRLLVDMKQHENKFIRSLAEQLLSNAHKPIHKNTNTRKTTPCHP